MTEKPACARSTCRLLGFRTQRPRDAQSVACLQQKAHYRGETSPGRTHHKSLRLFMLHSPLTTAHCVQGNCENSTASTEHSCFLAEPTAVRITRPHVLFVSSNIRKMCGLAGIFTRP